MTRQELVDALFKHYYEQKEYNPGMEYAYGFIDAVMEMNKMLKEMGCAPNQSVLSD